MRLAKILSFPSVEYCPVCFKPTEWYDDVTVILEDEWMVDKPVRRCSECDVGVLADGVVLYD